MQKRDPEVTKRPNLLKANP